MRKILIVGGDKRNEYLYNFYKISNDNVKHTFLLDYDDNINKLINESDIIITAIPFTKDNKIIYNPMCEKKLQINEFINLVYSKIVISGNLSNEIKENLKKNNNKIIDIMKLNELAIKNAVPTAEGVIKAIIENTDITIHESNIAILGFGRAGKRIAYVLKNLDASVYCFDIKKEEVANIKSCGYNVIEDICSDMHNVDIIVNTIPECILNKNVLDSINKETFIIDVASNSGGIDYDYAKLNGYKFLHELGIPGKVAPKTSAKYIKSLIDKLII